MVRDFVNSVRQYENLTVYKSSLEFLTASTKLVARMDRNYKYGLGQDINHVGVSMIEYIIKGHTAKGFEEKIENLKIAVDKVNKNIVLFRVVNKLNLAGRELYIHCLDLLISVSHFLEGWITSLEAGVDLPKFD